MVASLADKSSLVYKASWPGIRLPEGDQPSSQGSLGERGDEGKGVATAIVPGAQRVASLGPPEAAVVRRVIGGLLNEGVVPNASLSAEVVSKWWENLARART